MSLEKIRAEIDRLDEQIVDLLNRRTARAIYEVRRTHHMAQIEVEAIAEV